MNHLVQVRCMTVDRNFLALSYTKQTHYVGLIKQVPLYITLSQQSKQPFPQQKQHKISMGFHLFCSSTKSLKPNNSAYLYNIQGQIEILDLPMRVAELIHKSPGYIICPVDELRVSRVIWVLRANEELLAGEFYMMLSGKRAYSKVSELEWGVIKEACKKKKGGKVVPVGLLENEEEKDHHHHTGASHSSCKPAARSRQWRPVLEAISEGS